MTTSGTPLDRYEPLIAALLSVFAASPGPRAKATLPAGRREEVVGLLTRLVADPPLFDAYVGRVRTLRRNLGAEAELRLLGGAESDVQWEQVAARGFAGLPDDVLADLATSPEALEAFDEAHVQTGDDLGPWFFEAVEQLSPPLDPVETRPKQPLSPPAPAVTPAAQRPRGGRFLRWAVPAGLAAGLLLGGLSGWALRGPGENKGETVAVARADIEASRARGPGDKPQLSVVVKSPFGGFVTVVALYANLKQQVTEPSDDFDPISAGGSKPVLLKDASAVTVVFVVTETPAGEVIRRRLVDDEPRFYTASEAEQFSRDLETLLKETGFKRYAIGRQAVPTNR